MPHRARPPRSAFSALKDRLTRGTPEYSDLQLAPSHPSVGHTTPSAARCVTVPVVSRPYSLLLPATKSFTRQSLSPSPQTYPISMYTANITPPIWPQSDYRNPEYSLPPSYWATPCTHTESTLHQLSPYIGKLKSVIARDLISRFSKPGALVADMFCGSGTVPLEAALLGRRVFASDASVYAMTLTRAKLHAPTNAELALEELQSSLSLTEDFPLPDLRRVPKWVRQFFHPKTLKESIRLCDQFKRNHNYFFLACLLGILHHQRPGFLSFPSSHLVPYLRTRKFPQSIFPHLFEYRAIVPRIKSKIMRALKRAPQTGLHGLVAGIVEHPIDLVDLPRNIDCVITSPPYMNALDYVRDNRLRLWFLGEPASTASDRTLSSLRNFRSSIASLAIQLREKMRIGGFCVFVVGDRTIRSGQQFPSEELIEIFSTLAPNLVLQHVISDVIPDIRRSRQHLSGVKRENILVFRSQ